MKTIVFINVLRYLTLSLSLIGFACHFAQCTIFSEYQRRTGIPSWIHAGHWQYLAWFVTFVLSILSALAVCTHATCCKRAHILRGDKCLGIVNIIPLTATILANTFFAGQEPWTNGIVEFKVSAKGFITYCGMLDQDNDASYPLLLQRCILLDSTYVSAVMLWLSWILLVLSTCIFKPNKKISSVARLPNETGWKISERRKSSKAIMDNAYHHPYSKRHSNSFENHNPFQYNVTPANNAYTNKYATPIAPHIEKLQLSESYDNRHSNLLKSQERPISLSRHHPQTLPGGWAEYITSPPGASPYYYQDHHGGGHETNNPWYPNIVKNRVV